jgi:hypothetical protein
MNEESDQFEQRLSRQPLRQIPAGWREEILVAADVYRRNRPVREFTFAATTFRESLSTLNAQLAALLWPHPAAWAGLAAVWILILAMDFSARDRSPAMAANSAPPSPAVMLELRQQQRLLAELIGSRDTSDADRSKSFVPHPRSERAELMAA